MWEFKGISYRSFVVRIGRERFGSVTVSTNLCSLPPEQSRVRVRCVVCADLEKEGYLTRSSQDQLPAAPACLSATQPAYFWLWQCCSPFSPLQCLTTHIHAWGAAARLACAAFHQSWLLLGIGGSITSAPTLLLLLWPEPVLHQVSLLAWPVWGPAEDRVGGWLPPSLHRSWCQTLSAPINSHSAPLCGSCRTRWLLLTHLCTALVIRHSGPLTIWSPTSSPPSAPIINLLSTSSNT